MAFLVFKNKILPNNTVHSVNFYRGFTTFTTNIHENILKRTEFIKLHNYTHDLG